ncbi:helix-turn-helix domain-containing protein [Rhodococcus tibetensis]|uniref:GAF domain-containing protein n=1 Tax=Rhodococcus tibetensis TaxID=2965064 RepID=A0ABT1QJ87_9NOCA|nr:GAF domain-containing protein [Rhodococcus sp. FXJ9.536]MCQ4122341.1 GAF domain-containing protein [Rhodococcus sp. FXJ9.536]
MQEGWLELLLGDTTAEELIAHRDALLSMPETDPSQVTAAANATLELRALLDQRRQRATELAALNDISTQLTTMHDHRALLTEIVSQVKRLLGVDLAYIGLISGEGLIIEVASGAYTSHLQGLELPRHEGLMGRVIARREPVWTSDYPHDPSFPHTGKADAAARSENMRGLLSVPLQLGGRVFGALTACKRQERTFSNDEIALLSALAAHASVAIDNLRSLEQYRATVDEVNAANAELARRTEVLEQTLRWDRSLTEVVLRGGGVRDLIREMSSSTGCPMFFVSQPGDLPEGLDGSKEAVAELFAMLDTDSAENTAMRPRGDGYIVVGREVRAAGDRLGVLLMLCRDEEPGAGRLLILDRSAPALALALVGERAAHEVTRRARDAFVIDLLTRPSSVEKESRQQFRLAGLNPDRTYTVVVARPADDVGRTRSAIGQIDLPSSTVVAEYGSRVVVLVPSMEPADVVEAWVQPDTEPTVGLADPARGGDGLAQAFTAAEQTVDVLETLGRRSQVVPASMLGIYRVLLSRTSREQLEAVAEQTLGPLLREQEPRGAPLIDTLTSYLEHDRRHAATAADLGIHVNTLYQRLESIDRLIGVGWREPEQAFDLQLLLRLRGGSARLTQR